LLSLNGFLPESIEAVISGENQSELFFRTAHWTYSPAQAPSISIDNLCFRRPNQSSAKNNN
ncbi:MAG: hypothetical protein AAGJ35_14185, partial [Myxococcota bacterium]